MRFLLPLSLLAAVASAAAVAAPVPDDTPYPMPTVVHSSKPVTPFPMPTVVHSSKPNDPYPMPSVVPDPEKPRACTKICASSGKNLKCGEGWEPAKLGECWACCRVEMDDD